MAAIANMSLNDGQVTPVAHVFLPVRSSPFPIWRDSQAGVPLISQPTLSLQILAETDEYIKFRRVTTLPVAELVSGQNTSGYTAAPKNAFVNRTDAVHWISKRSTDQQKKDFRAFESSITGQQQFIDLFLLGQIPY